MVAEPKLGIHLPEHEIKAFHEGCKTQIRMIAVRSPWYGNGNVYEQADGSLRVEHTSGGCGAGWETIQCPLQIGDVVFVREPWSVLYASFEGVAQVAYPRAPRGGALWKQRAAKVTPEKEWQAFLKKYNVDLNGSRVRPNTQMKAWASRVLLTVTGRSVDRILDTSLEDSEASGYEIRGDKTDAATCTRGTFFHSWFTEFPACRYSENPYVWVFDVTAEIRPCIQGL